MDTDTCKIHASAAAGTGGATLGDICKMEQIAARGQEMPPHARQIYQLASAEKWRWRAMLQGARCVVYGSVHYKYLYVVPSPTLSPASDRWDHNNPGRGGGQHSVHTNTRILHSIEIPCQALNLVSVKTAPNIY